MAGVVAVADGVVAVVEAGLGSGVAGALGSGAVLGVGVGSAGVGAGEPPGCRTVAPLFSEPALEALSTLPASGDAWPPEEP